MNGFGLDEKDWKMVAEILATCPRIEKTVLFGSRAKGNFRPGSDVDLALFGDLTFQDKMELSSLFYDSLLPWKVDLLLVDSDTLPQILDHVKRVGKVVFETQPIEKTVSKMRVTHS